MKDVASLPGIIDFKFIKFLFFTPSCNILFVCKWHGARELIIVSHWFYITLEYKNTIRIWDKQNKKWGEIVVECEIHSWKGRKLGNSAIKNIREKKLPLLEYNTYRQILKGGDMKIPINSYLIRNLKLTKIICLRLFDKQVFINLVSLLAKTIKGEHQKWEQSRSAHEFISIPEEVEGIERRWKCLKINYKEGKERMILWVICIGIIWLLINLLHLSLEALSFFVSWWTKQKIDGIWREEKSCPIPISLHYSNSLPL